MESKICSLSEMWTQKMPKGMGLEIFHHPTSMRHVANLIIAMERLRAGVSERVLSTDFRDENLLSIMLESIVEEKLILETHSAQPDQFSRVSEHFCSVSDSEKRSLIRVQNSMELQAVMLQGGSDDRKITLNMTTYVHPTSSTEALPVALGIKDTNLYLSCDKKGDTPTLYLEAVEDKESFKMINSRSEMKRFLFYKQDIAMNNSTLMSASFPNWYISTSTQDNRPVEMCQVSAPRYTNFNIQQI
ncbi:interleukin-1 beta [Kryptolebias marmoratus]|uniref:Interleukin-1 n=1 Tax=Kryptolebias marmoratus TaxID=37003 RepID=A0A3Q3EN61_KRYMA|nr:interleukin-1 beta [Kryptolebias marmoratus]XP_037834693.1 interleukin-1 beta [Kryptolebias marmoratus]